MTTADYPPFFDVRFDGKTEALSILLAGERAILPDKAHSLIRATFELVAKEHRHLQPASAALSDETLCELLEVTGAFTWLRRSPETVSALLIAATPLFLQPYAFKRRGRLHWALTISPDSWTLFPPRFQQVESRLQPVVYNYRAGVVHSFRYFQWAHDLESLRWQDAARRHAGLPEDPVQSAELCRLTDLTYAYETAPPVHNQDPV
jgi:hypothetical protein